MMMQRLKVIFVILLITSSMVYSENLQASYKSDLNKATKKTEMYDVYTGSLKIEMYATLFTDDFRKSFAMQDIEVNHLDSFEAEKKLAEENEKQKKGWEVFVSLYAPKAYSKFSNGKDTFWKTYLTVASGESVYPVSIEKINIRPYWKVMFPHITRWATPYKVVFPKVTLGKKASMTMESVVGHTTVTWKLK